MITRFKSLLNTKLLLISYVTPFEGLTELLRGETRWRGWSCASRIARPRLQELSSPGVAPSAPFSINYYYDDCHRDYCYGGAHRHY